MHVSIVSGTYNRLPHLMKMVSSVRRSVRGLDYEIVLVDGGSTDGTIGWCQGQGDIHLIRQGDLYGAVRAFNAGARAARGDYVILANDDIEFVDLSILCAFSTIDSNQAIGIGCFYQDRGGQHWHVEHMPAISPRGTQASVYYGQVCIIPKWLGDAVGWWGDYLYTYGGDNELSCNVIEVGYLVVPIQGAMIHDMRIHDELRSINKGDPLEVARSGGMHPDSAKWRAKWTKGKLVGPQIQSNVRLRDNEPYKRILYAPIYEPGHEIQHETKTGLRKALEKVGIVIECDYMTEGIKSLLEISCQTCPDLFVIQAQDASKFTESIVKQLRKDHPDAVLVAWNGDYHPDNLYDEAYISMLRHFHRVGMAVASVADLYSANGVNWFYWQIGYEETSNGQRQDKSIARHDVVFLGNAYSQQRKELGRVLLDHRSTGIDVGLYGTWPSGWSMGDCLYDFETGASIYRKAKLAVSDQQWPEATGYVSNRLFQAMAAGGCLVLQQEFDGMTKYLGLVNGTHLVTWRDFDDLKWAIDYYISNPEEAQDIARAGHKFMLEHHSFDVRVQELLNVLGW